ncbi:MAG TPA: hypothetical protein VEJ86_12800 [Candidatus Binataceae bacterium]|nr:hypothetical protein [Candidatus Binataceae bacterium]
MGSDPEPPPGFLFSHPLFVPLILLILTVAMFATLFFPPGDRVISPFGNDISAEFIYWRQFGFEQLRSGHVALWNPHQFCGEPFMGGFQAALFYPPNLIYLLLPVSVGINLEVALHVFLLGLFMSLWLRRYELAPAAILMASAVVMFSGEAFMRIYAGNLTTLDEMAWVPLLFLTVDELLENPGVRWVLVGVFAFAMQMFAGHPQWPFNTAVACGLYGAMGIRRAPRRVATLFAGIAVVAGAVLIGAVQLWSGLEVAEEGRRSGGAAFSFVASFPFPLENLATFLVPGLFGNGTSYPYWGKWGMESAFVGVTALTMAGYGLTVRASKRWSWLAMAVLLFTLGFGDLTPLLHLLYRFVPGFDLFRGPARIVFQGELFLVMLAGLGMDRLIRSGRGALLGGWIVLGVASVLGLAGLALESQAWTFRTLWAMAVSAVTSDPGTLLTPPAMLGANFLNDSARLAASGLLTAAATALIISALLFARRWRAEAAYVLAVFGIVEVFIFARASVVSFSGAQAFPTMVRDFLGDHPGDYRMLHFPITQTNSAMVIGASDVWGYDPAAPERYAELFNYLVGSDPDDPLMRLSFRQASPMLRLFRLRFIFLSNETGLHPSEIQNPLPHALLVGGWLEQTQRDEIFSTINSPSFDPERTVILEDAPEPEPVDAEDSAGTAKVVSNGTDSMTIIAETNRPSILLLTDTYSRYWRARALKGSSQASYAVMPADYALMAIPLASGKHRISLDYAPPGYTVGKWISLAGLAGYLILAAVLALRRRNEVGGSARA